MAEYYPTLLSALTGLIVLSLGTEVVFKLLNNDATNVKETKSSAIPESVSVSPSPSVEGSYTKAAVTSARLECSQIGTRIMEVDGGSAVDAAIATVLCIGVLNPQSCGLGGGHFLTFYKKSTGSVRTVIAREQAPSGATEDMFVENPEMSVLGGKAIGIPGEVRGYYEAHKLGGRLPWKALFQPSIELAEGGFKVGEFLSRTIADVKETILDAYPNLRALVTNPNTGQRYKTGEIMRRPKLANTLSIIAAEGPDAFYTGSLTDDLIADMQEEGAIITKSDLASYKAVVKDALMFRLRDKYKVYSPPLPSGGPVYLYILNILNGYNMDARNIATPDDAVLTWHRMTEAFKHGFAMRTRLGDGDVGTEAFKAFISETVTNMLDPNFGEVKRRRINDSTTFEPEYYEPLFANTFEGGGTCQIAVLSSNGDAVSITSTVNLSFGSKVVGSRTDVVFNNEMDDFSTPNTTNSFGVPASPANFIKPFKRPLSSMSPSLVVGPDGNVALITGSSGGTRIISTITTITINTLLFHWSIKEAIDYPRIHHQLFPEQLSVEDTFPQVLIDGLRSKGHAISQVPNWRSFAQGVLRRKRHGKITANSDWRRLDGGPDGFLRL